MEIWDLYDGEGNRTGETWERSRAGEIPEGRYHIVCDVLIRHRDGSFLLMKRDPEKDGYPGCWEAGAGGAALAGEGPEEAARREMLEETGLVPETLDLIGVTRRSSSRSILYAYVASVACGRDDVRLQKGETVDHRWMARGPFLAAMREEELLAVQYERFRPYLERI